MATIVLSDLAPTGEAVHFSLPGVDFDLGGSGKGTNKSYETTDRAVLSNAAQHPWLDVQYDPAETVQIDYPSTQVAPEDDSQGALGPNANIAFDPDEIRKVEEAKFSGEASRVAIDSGLDQDKSITTGEVAETVAAANDNDGTKD